MASGWTLRSTASLDHVAAEFGLQTEALDAIFGFPRREVAARLPLVPGCPDDQALYWQRDFEAIDVFYAAIGSRQLAMPCPYGLNPAPVPVRHGLNLPSLGGTFATTQLWVFGQGEQQFVAAGCAIYPRITQLLLPARRLLIWYPPYRQAAEALASAADGLVATCAQLLPLDAELPVVCGVDMVVNYGHQLLNHLAGLQRLLDSGLAAAPAEIWLHGLEFFAPVETLFPELAGRCRRFATRAEFCAAANRLPGRFQLLGSCFFPQALRQRVLQQLPAAPEPSESDLSEPEPSAPVLVVTLRGGSRRCLNLVDVVAALAAALHGVDARARVILDGFVLAEGAIRHQSNVATLLAGPPPLALQEELEQAAAMAERLPAGMLLANTLGQSMHRSLELLRQATCYFAHVGTLQHKLSYLLDLPGLIHGPAAQLRSREAGHWFQQGRHTPLFLAPEEVDDAGDSDSDSNSAGDSTAMLHDYTILDPAAVAERFVRELLL